MDYDGEICPRYRYDCPQIQYNWRHSAWKTNVFPLSCVYLCDMNFLCLSFSVPLLFVCFFVSLCVYMFVPLYLCASVCQKEAVWFNEHFFVFFVVSFVEIMTFDRLCLVGMVRKVSVVLRSLNDIVRRRTMSTAGRYHSSHDHFGQKGLQCQQKHFIQRNYTIVLYCINSLLHLCPPLVSWRDRLISKGRLIVALLHVYCTSYIYTFLHLSQWVSGENLDLNLI